MSKKSKWLIGLSIAFSLVFWITGITILVMMSILPFPERFSIADMDDYMISIGQGAVLLSFYIGLPIAAIGLIGSLITWNILIWRSYVSCSGVFTTLSIQNKFVKFLTCLGIGLSVILPPLFMWFILYPTISINKQLGDATNYKVQGSSKLWKRLLIYPLAIFYPLLVVFSVCTAEKKQLYVGSVPMRKQDYQKSLTLSRDNQNTMVFFWDRAMGSHVYKLLALDYLYFNKENGIINKSGTSFAELFPEFTYYINNFSAGDLTNFSVSTITGSWNYLTALKTLDVKGIENSKDNSALGQSEWLKDAHQSAFKMMQENGYKQLSLISNPYYGSLTWEHNTNSKKLQKELREGCNNNEIYIYDQNEVSKTLDGKVYNSPIDDMKATRAMGANKKSIKGIIQDDNTIKFAPDDLNTNPAYLDNKFGANEQLTLKDNPDNINLAVEPNKPSTLMYFHSGVTHEKYVHISNSQFINNKWNVGGINYDNPSDGIMEYPDARKALKTKPKEDIFFSEWFMIQKMKDILIYLKNLPYTGTDSYIKNQYDNTNIYIISDHGTMLNYDKDAIANKLNYLFRDNGYITQQDVDEYLGIKGHFQNFSKVDSIFFRKPRQLKNASWNKSTAVTKNIDYLKNLFDFKTFVSIADLFPIIEADIQMENQDRTASGGDFTFDYNNSYYVKNSYATRNASRTLSSKDKRALSVLLDNVLIPNPLGKESADKMTNRKIPLIFAANFWHQPNKKSYPILRVVLFDQNKVNKNKTFLTSSYLNPDGYQQIWYR